MHVSFSLSLSLSPAFSNAHSSVTDKSNTKQQTNPKKQRRIWDAGAKPNLNNRMGMCVCAFASSKNSNIINFHCEWRFLCGMPMHATERIRVK